MVCLMAAPRECSHSWIARCVGWIAVGLLLLAGVGCAKHLDKDLEAFIRLDIIEEPIYFNSESIDEAKAAMFSIARFEADHDKTLAAFKAPDPLRVAAMAWLRLAAIYQVKSESKAREDAMRHAIALLDRDGVFSADPHYRADKAGVLADMLQKVEASRPPAWRRHATSARPSN